MKKIRKRARLSLHKAKWKVWSWQNWRKGYKFGPIQRFRCCDHTTPFHYGWCAEGHTTADKIVW